MLLGERQPALRLGGGGASNQGWSVDYVLDRSAEEHELRTLTIVDDATHDAVAHEVELTISDQGIARVLERPVLPEACRS